MKRQAILSILNPKKLLKYKHIFNPNKNKHYEEKQSRIAKNLSFHSLVLWFTQLSAQTVTKTFKNESLKSVLKEVERQTKMSVIYKVDEVNTNKKVTATFRSTPVREVLNRVLGNDLNYEIDNKMITIHNGNSAHNDAKFQCF